MGQQAVKHHQLYFGCGEGLGHYFFGPDGRHLRGWTGTDFGLPWAHVDGTLTPRANREQGSALLHYFEGWTALAINDYSIDKRPGSNANFFIDERYTELEHILRRFREFPEDSFFVQRLDQIGPIRLVDHEVRS